MKLLITGMTGLIGTRLWASCEQKGITVHYLTSDPDKIEKRPDCKGFYWNPDRGEIDEACIAGVDKIVHLAGASVSKRWTKRHKQEILSSRKRTAELLYTLLSNHTNQVTQILSASAIGIYPSSLTTLYTEDSPERAGDFLGQVVREWENAADQFRNLGLLVTKIRIGLVLAHGGLLEKLKKPIQNYVGSCLGSGKQWQSWIHIEDLVEMMIYVLNNELQGVFNGVAPNPVKQHYLIKSIAKTLHKPLVLPAVPEFMLKLILGEMATMVLSSQLVANTRLEDSDFRFRFTQIDRAIEDLLK